MRPQRLITLLVLLALAAPTAPAHAGGVVSVCDEAHLKAALAGGDAVTFSCSGVITLTSTIEIAANTTIDGSGQNITISGNDGVGVFSVMNSGATLNLNVLTIADGLGYRAGGIDNSHGGTVTVNNSAFSGNRGSYGGGIDNSGPLTVSNSTFSGNYSQYGGDGIHNDYWGTVTVNNSTFSRNSASDGIIFFNGGRATVTNSTFSDDDCNENICNGRGIGNWGTMTVINSAFVSRNGGILNVGELTVTNSTFSGNIVTEGSGGGIENYGTVTVSDSTFSGNSATYYGGGIYNNSGMVTVSNSTFSGNSAYYHGGGGIYNYSGELTVTNSTFSGNSTSLGGGGGINNSDGTATVSDSTFSNNSASFGGGIANRGELTVTNSTFSGNSATNGGGIDNDGGTVFVTNGTFSSNSAINGGGIDNSDSGTVTVTNSTFSGNSAINGGGICNFYGSAVTIKNTIIASSPQGGNCYGGTMINGGGNLSYPDATCPGINSDPVLGPLQDNGGPTKTIGLLPGSAAVDAANNAICAADPANNFDQRGASRRGACDIGAYEYGGTLTTLTSSANPALLMATLVFTATVVKGESAAFTGSVTFYADGAVLDTRPLDAGGVASLSVNSLSLGTHVITATYTGDDNFAASTGRLTPDQVIMAPLWLPLVMR